MPIIKNTLIVKPMIYTRFYSAKNPERINPIGIASDMILRSKKIHVLNIQA